MGASVKVSVQVSSVMSSVKFVVTCRVRTGFRRRVRAQGRIRAILRISFVVEII